MIKTITIKNFKSIVDLTIKPGRLTVLIGENGGGKSNILEAISLGGAAASGNLNNEFMAVRGARITAPHIMRAAFQKDSTQEPISLDFDDFNYQLTNDNKPYSKWQLQSSPPNYFGLEFKNLQKYFKEHPPATISKDALTATKLSEEVPADLFNFIVNYDFFSTQLINAPHGLKSYVIYSPENTTLRTFESETQLEPLGANGSGLFKLLKVLHQTSPKKIKEIKKNLCLINWFHDFEIPDDLYTNETRIQIKDRYIDTEVGEYNQKNANEGFLFLLFYTTLLVSEETPTFFAIDNIEASFNPKLCTRLISTMADLAKKHGKQVIVTTHNPAILDGVDLNDPDQKILVISRNKDGHTRAKEVRKPVVQEGEEPVKLSEAFLSGMLGGLPKGF